MFPAYSCGSAKSEEDRGLVPSSDNPALDKEIRKPTEDTEKNETVCIDDEQFIVLSEHPEQEDEMPCRKSEGSSLFPAYSNDRVEADHRKPDGEVWLNNESFTVLSQLQDSSSSAEDSQPSDKEETASSLELKPPERKRSKKEKESLVLPPPPLMVLSFDGSEQFYVDKKSERGYLKVDTLHRPACANYRSGRKSLGQIRRKPKDNFKRYYSKKNRLSDFRSKNPTSELPPIDNEEFLEANKLLNQSIADNNKNPNNWIDLVNYQDRTPMKSLSNTQLAERKFDILDKALLQNPRCDELYTVYLGVANKVFPSFEVSKIIEKLLGKDPTNYVLWRGMILATQGSMARCVVPDVLQLYERAMSQMYKKRRADEIMLKLFKSCAFFLRQSGLNEQLFALIKLALELNVNPDQFNSIKPSESDQNLLIEFEEVVLSSGLPMNEIWLRIEKLRTNFYFLPCPSGFTCSDPQRMVFNEDVCHFIYPLNYRENGIKLVLIILRLLKVPLLVYKFQEREESEWDCIEDILPVFLQRTFTNDSHFDGILWDLTKELVMGPSYFNSLIGNEVYTNAVLEMLNLLAACFTGIDKMVINLICLRFERLLVVMAKRDGKLTEEMKKKSRSKLKKFLKIEENRNEINYYVEFAALEYDLENKDMALNVLESSYNQGMDSGISNKDKYHICTSLVEFHLADNRRNDAMKVLMALGMNASLADEEEDIVTESKKLVALAALKKNVETMSGIESHVEVMEEEQTHLPDYFINSIKCLVYLQSLIKSKSEALRTMTDLRGVFNNKSNNRHGFLREQFCELEIAIKSLAIPNDSVSLTWKDFEAALHEYPHNLFIIKRLVNYKGVLWYKMKSLALKSQSSTAVIFLIASVRLWYSEALQNDSGNHVTAAHKYRVRSLLQEAVIKDEVLKKNSLLWRLYLRILFELENHLDQCKNALFSALDECPWNKSLYMDGAVFVPQELTQIQDLIIEKQLRIYALPEELEILRREGVQELK